MTERALPPELLLVAACCRWPLSETALTAIRAAGIDAIDWAYVLRIARRQRVEGLVHHALLLAGMDMPPAVAQQLALWTQRTARRNMALAAETVRLQRAFDAARIPVVVLKGAALAQLAYGSLTLKHSKDIDLMIPSDRAQEALHLLEKDGYALQEPVPHLDAAQWRAVICYGNEIVVAHPHRRLQVELRWRLTDNPLLFEGVDVLARTQDVALADGASVRTFADENLLAYLAVHGAGHGWSRLKWLADFNAVIAGKTDEDIERFHRFARSTGGGLCAGQALLLCNRLLALRLAERLYDELKSSRRLEKLVKLALDMMVGADAETELHRKPVTSTRLSFIRLYFMLGEGWRYYVAQCRVSSVKLHDVIEYQLPPALHFLYPVLRLPLLLWRRLRR